MLTGKVISDGLNVHDGGPTGYLITSLAKGDTFKVLDQKTMPSSGNIWLIIDWPGATKGVAWVCKRNSRGTYVDIIHEADPAVIEVKVKPVVPWLWIPATFVIIGVLFWLFLIGS